MKKVILLLCSILLTTTFYAQTLQNGVPVILSNAGDCGEQIFSTGSDGTSFKVTSRDNTLLYSSSITNSGDNYSVNSVNILPSGSDFSVRYLDDAPTFHTTAAAGTAPNRDVTLQALSAIGNTEYLQTYTTSADDFGLKTIGARSPIGGTLTDGAFTVAAREGADGLYQLVALRTDENGDISWETVIPAEQTGYDILFQGQVDGEFVYETQPVPVISIVKEMPDGYIIINQNKLYSPPTQTEQFANIIKLDFEGNVLWNNNFKIPWRELEIGSNSSADLGFRGRVTSVEGTQDGNTYFTFSSSGDINPNAQFRQLDNTGAVIQSFSTSWFLNDNYSWLIKEIDGEVYWVKLSGLFIDDGPPTNAFDFAIFNITDGIDNIGSANNPLAFLPPTPGVTFIPKDLEQLENGDFIVTGAYYAGVSFPDFFFDAEDGETFIVRLENQELSNAGADLSLSVTANDENTGIYEDIEITYTVTNEGNTAATGVTAKISRTSGSVLAGSSPATASQGNLELGYTEEALWQIGDLAPGQTETLTLTYFTLAANTSFFGEISEMNEADTDSTPDNGTFGNAQEDDEAGIEIGPQPFVITGRVFLDEMRQGGIFADNTDAFLEGIEIQLFIQGTDDLIATATSNSNGTYIFTNVSPENNYSLRYAVQNDLVHINYFVTGTNFDFRSNFVITDDELGARIGVSGNDGPEIIKNLALTDGTQCTLEELYVETLCNDNGTPNNPNDDTFSLNFRADGLGLGEYNISNANGSLNSNRIIYSNGFVNSASFPISSFPVTLTISNLATLPSVSCSLSESINDLSCDGTVENLPDLTFIDLGANAPVTAEVGEQFIQFPNLRATNIGLIASPAGQFIPTRVYLSTDGSVSSDDVEIDFSQFQPLAVGFENPVGSISIPDDIAPGVYQVLRFIDANNDIEESNENNNVFSTQITITAGNTDCAIAFPGSGTGGSFCMDNGTPNDPSDDFYNFNFTPEMIFGSGNYSVDIPTINANGTISYTTVTNPSGTTIFQTVNIQDAEAAFGGTILYTVTDATDASCVNTISFVTPDICSQTGSGDVDLELTASSDTPTIYQSGQAVFTITNNGTQTATGVRLEFKKNSTVNITGAPTTSQGASEVHWTDTPRWNVGTLAAGQSETITFDIFSLSNDINFYAQVTAQNENDADSTPDNGNGTSANEDDEVSYPNEGIELSPCTELIAIVNNIQCSDNGTPSDASDDTYTFDVLVESNGTECSNAVVVASSTPYGFSTNLGEIFTSAPLSIAGGTLNFFVGLQGTDGSPSTTISVTPPATCSEQDGFFVTCATGINPALPVQIDPTDDYSGRVVTWNPPTATTDCPGGLTIEQVNGPTSGSFFNVWTTYTIVYIITDDCDSYQECIFEIFVEGITGFLQCPDDITVDATSAAGAVVNFEDAMPITSCNASPVSPAPSGLQSGDIFPIGTTELEFSTFFTGSAAFCQNMEFCSMTVTVLPEGGGGDSVDLELTASSDAPTIYQNGTATFTITNNGNETATGVELEFHKNSTLNITGTPTVTQGTSQLHWTDVPRWNVGTLAAGESAMITYDIFSLSEDINFYGQVTAQNEVDADSTPNNGDGTTATEDDEVSYPGGEVVNPYQFSVTQIEYFCDDQGTTDPSDDTWTQSYAINNTDPNATGYTISPFSGGGTYPDTLSFGGLVAAAGFNPNMYLIVDNDGAGSSTIGVFPPVGCGEDPVEDLADLTLSNLNANPGAAGEISEYTVEVSNIGLVDVSGSYVIGAYLSTDNQLSSNDIQVGVINTGNTPIGTEPLTTGSITIPTGQTPGNYFLILETDTNGNIAESNENNNIVATPITVLVVDPGCLLNIEIGTVSCSTAGTPNDVSDDTYTFTFTVFGQNVSNTALMTANADVPAIVNIGQPYTISGIPASEPHVVLTAIDPDDSACQAAATVNPPGTCGQGTGGCDITLDVVSINCQLYTNPSTGVENDTYFYWLTASGNASLGGWYPDAPFNSYDFDQSNLFSGSIAEGPQTVTATALNDETCVTQVTIVPPAPCGNADGCVMSIFTNNIVCTGNNYSLDMFLNVTAGAYIITLPLANGSGGTYEITDVLGGDSEFISYPTADVLNNLGGEINYTVRRVDNSDCVVEGTLFIPSNCTGDAGDGIDLSLDINAPSSIGQYQNFVAEYIITNNGTATANNVSLDFFAIFENNFVFQGGNEGSVTQGGFDGSLAGDFTSNTWDVGSIPPGGSATLSANLFSLAPSTNTLWAEIATHNETDNDSNPTNGIYPQVNEDDEAVFTVNITSNVQGGGGTANSAFQINELSAQLYPVPTRDNLSIDVFTQSASETQLFIRDTHGKVLTTRNLAAQKGMQTVQINTDNWANGVYFLQLFSGEEMKTYRFVKQ